MNMDLLVGELIPGSDTLTHLLGDTSSSSTINAQSVPNADPNGDDMNDPGDDVTNVLLGADEVLGTGVSEMGSDVGHTGIGGIDWSPYVRYIRDGISEIERDGNTVVSFFGENVLNYNLGYVLGASGIYEMLIFFDNRSPTELPLGDYKDIMIGMIVGFLQGLTTLMNHGRNRYKLSQAPDSIKEEKFHYFTSSFVFEIRDGNENVVFYCEFGRIQNVVEFKNEFMYSRDSLEEIYKHQDAALEKHPLLPYYLNDDGFLFTFFLTMKTMKIKRGIAHFEKCINKIKQHRFMHGDNDRKRAFKNKLIHLFTDRFKRMFHLSMVMPVVPASGKTMYLPLYEIMQTEILQEIFIIFDAKVDDGGDRLSYRDFVKGRSPDGLANPATRSRSKNIREMIETIICILYMDKTLCHFVCVIHNGFL